MAHNPLRHVFDADGILAAANNSRKFSTSSSHYEMPVDFEESPRTHQPRVMGRGSTRRHNLPRPSISQWRKGSQAGGVSSPSLSSRKPTLFGDELSDAGCDVANEHEPELTDQELFAVLQKHNKSINEKKYGTLRLPSDVLHRRKSRFDTDNFEAAAGDRAHGAGNGLRQLNFTDLAMVAARTREEDDPIKKTYKKLQSFYQETTLLKTTLNRIQGRYGAAIMEYFSFVKWLVMLNIVISLLTLPMILPEFTLPSLGFNGSILGVDNQNLSCYQTQAEECSMIYNAAVEDVSDHKISETYLFFLDFIQGTGMLERTALFYGYYNRKQLGTTEYPMPIIFLCATFLALIVSLSAILYSISSHHKSTVVVTGDGTAAQKFSTSVLSGWDYGLMERRAVKVKRELLKQELQQLVAEKKYKDVIQQRTRCQKYGLWLVRLLVNILVLGTLGGCSYAIFRVSLIAEDNQIQFSEYLPAVLITAIYLVVPTFFDIVVRLERYRPNIELGITMARILSLRLASLFFLIITTFSNLRRESSENENPPTGNVTDCDPLSLMCGNPLFSGSTSSLGKCWETYIGQQIYRLYILDLAVLLATTYLIEYPRQSIFKRFQDTKLMKWLGQQEFDMPKNVMDVLYNQILCWIGIFFSPIIPLMTTVKMILFFLIKRGSLFQNQRPSATLSKSSTLSSFFYLVMWISLVLAYLVLIVYMQTVPPSQSCGPFRVYFDDDFKMIHVITKILPDFITDVVDLLGNRLVQVAIILVLLVLWYLFWTISNGQSAEAKLYVDQLTKSVKDKQFILAQVNQAIQETNDATFSPKPSTSTAPIANMDRAHDSRRAERMTGRPFDSHSETNNYENAPISDARHGTHKVEMSAADNRPGDYMYVDMHQQRSDLTHSRSQQNTPDQRVIQNSERDERRPKQVSSSPAAFDDRMDEYMNMNQESSSLSHDMHIAQKGQGEGRIPRHVSPRTEIRQVGSAGSPSDSDSINSAPMVSHHRSKTKGVRRSKGADDGKDYMDMSQQMRSLSHSPMKASVQDQHMPRKTERDYRQPGGISSSPKIRSAAATEPYSDTDSYEYQPITTHHRDSRRQHGNMAASEKTSDEYMDMSQQRVGLADALRKHNIGDEHMIRMSKRGRVHPNQHVTISPDYEQSSYDNGAFIPEADY